MIGDTARQRTARRARLLTTVLLAGAAAALLGGSPAYAAGTCDYDPSSENVMITFTGPSNVTVGRTTGSALTVSSTDSSFTNIDCNGVSLGSIGSIIIASDSSDNSTSNEVQTVTIDLTNGVLAPGNALEPTGTREIEISINLMPGTTAPTGDRVIVLGSSLSDTYVAGANGINLNGDDDVDITLAGVETTQLSGAGGNDTLTGQGGGAAGAVFPTAMAFVGGTGNDSLTGGNGNDTFIETAASNGTDVIEGKGGTDTAEYERANAVSLSVDDLPNDGEPGENDNIDVENLRSGNGDDVLSGTIVDPDIESSQNNSFHGGNLGSDTVSYSNISATVTASLAATGAQNTGGAGNDTYENSTMNNLVGGSGNDSLTGDGTNNALDGGPGNDRLDGGGGTGDTADYSSATNPVTVDLTDTAPQNTIGWGTDELDNIENLTGSTGDDTLTGSAANNVITGGSGADDLSGDDGDDTLNGGVGTDTLRGGNGRDTLNGGDGDDDLSGEAGDDVQNGEAGNDILDFTGRPAVTVDFGATPSPTTTGDDDATAPTVLTFDTFTGIELVRGSSNNDTFKSGPGNDAFEGGASLLDTDVADYGTVSAALTVDLRKATGTATGHGTDSFSKVEKVIGGSGNDSLIGSTGNDILDGNTGDDTLAGLAGNDTLTGGAGLSDTADYSVDATAVVTVDLGSPTAQNTGGAGTDTITTVENLIGTAVEGTDQLTGNADKNILNGLAGDDSLSGGTENDTLIGGLGDDDLSGQGGSDTADFSGLALGVTVNLPAQTASGQGNDEMASVENVIGSSEPDTIVGDGGANTLSGRGGSDTITGAEGDDTLNGEGGNDVLSGGGGRDTLDGGGEDDTLRSGSGGSTGMSEALTGGPGTDTADYSQAGGAVTVNMATPATNTGDAQFDTYTTVENLTGSAFGDTLTGDGGNNVITGLDGNDTLKGGGGTDTVSYSTAPSAVTVSLRNASAQNTGGAGTDTIDADMSNVVGSTHSGDNLAGDTGNNEIDGLAGVDTVTFAGAAAVHANLATETSIGDGTDTLRGLENITGSSNNDTLGGNLSDNVLIGNGGTDTLTFVGSTTGADVDLQAGTATGAGTDTVTGFVHVIGSSHNDTLRGTTGNNIITGGDGVDTVSYSNVTGTGVTVDLRITALQTTGAGDDTITQVENVTGSPQADTLSGDGGSNTLNGGDDTDTLSFAAATASVSANLGNGTATGDGTDALSNLENLTGSPQGDTLVGNSGANTINGGDGDDTIDGAGGNDTENGGAGDDTFYQGTAANGADTMSGGAHGAEGDLVDYSDRSSAVSVTFDGAANDGEAGEGDNVGTDVEDFVGPSAPPGAPTNVQATAGRGLATVTWSAPASNGGNPITGYVVTSTPDGRTASAGAAARSATVTGLRNGVTYSFTVTATNSAGTGAVSAPSNPVTPSDPAAGQGYALLGDDGGVFSFGAAGNFGSIPGLGLKLNEPPIGMAYTPTGKGYWIVARDGGIFSFGDAKFHGSMGNAKLNAPVLGMEPTPTGGGYWLFAADGGIFSFGDAKFHGSMGASTLNAPVIGMAATSTGGGYWLVAQDGGIFSFGDAKFHGSMGGSTLNQPVFDMAPTADNAGYWLVARDGGIFAFGNAKFLGSAAPSNPATVIGIGSTPAGDGYWIADRNGAVYAFGAAQPLGDLRGAGKTAVSFAALPK